MRNSKVSKTVTTKKVVTPIQSCFKVTSISDADNAMIDVFTAENIAYHKTNRNKTILGNDPKELKKFAERYEISVTDLTKHLQSRVLNLANEFPIGYEFGRTLRASKVAIAVLADSTVTIETVCTWKITSLVNVKGFKGDIQKISPYYNCAVSNSSGRFLCYAMVNYKSLKTIVNENK